MRIQFVSDERPTRVAKSLKKHLAALGHDFPFTTVREATAVMYGYRNWNDLRGQIGSAPASPSDQDSEESLVAERRSTFAGLLASRLGIARSTAEAAVDRVGPTSRRDPTGFSKAPYDFERDVIDIAKAFTADWKIEDHPSGAIGFFASRVFEARGIKLPVSGSIAIDGGGEIHGKGIDLEDVVTRGSIPEVEPDPRVLDFLRRLDPRAMRMLRGLRQVNLESYRIAASIPPNSGWARLMERLPVMVGEIASLAHDRTCGLPVDSDSLRERMIRSDDPMKEYVSIVQDYASLSWPSVKVESSRVRQTVEKLGPHIVRHDLGLLPWHTAFLSFAPEGKLPQDPSSIAQASAFIERWTVLFGPSVGMSPTDFFEEFDGDWARIEAIRANSMDSWIYFKPLASLLIQVAATEIGRPFDIEASLVEDVEALEPLTEAVRTDMVRGRGLENLIGCIDAIKKTLKEENEPTTEEVMHLLRTSGVLPSAAGADTVAHAIWELGIDPDDLIDKVETDLDVLVA